MKMSLPKEVNKCKALHTMMMASMKWNYWIIIIQSWSESSRPHVIRLMVLQAVSKIPTNNTRIIGKG